MLNQLWDPIVLHRLCVYEARTPVWGCSQGLCLIGWIIRPPEWLQSSYVYPTFTLLPIRAGKAFHWPLFSNTINAMSNTLPYGLHFLMDPVGEEISIRFLTKTTLINHFILELNLFFFNLFIIFLAAFILHCCTQAFSSCGERGLLFVAVRGLLIAVASLVAEHGL